MENQEQAQMETQPVGGEAPAAEPTPELTITDLINIRAVVDVAVRRGAFGSTGRLTLTFIDFKNCGCIITNIYRLAQMET